MLRTKSVRYFWRRPRFLPTFLPFARQEQHLLAILKALFLRKRRKNTTKIDPAFLARKNADFAVQSTILNKRQAANEALAIFLKPL